MIKISRYKLRVVVDKMPSPLRDGGRRQTTNSLVLVWYKAPERGACVLVVAACARRSAYRRQRRRRSRCKQSSTATERRPSATKTIHHQTSILTQHAFIPKPDEKDPSKPYRTSGGSSRLDGCGADGWWLIRDKSTITIIGRLPQRLTACVQHVRARVVRRYHTHSLPINT